MKYDINQIRYNSPPLSENINKSIEDIEYVLNNLEKNSIHGYIVDLDNLNSNENYILVKKDNKFIPISLENLNNALYIKEIPISGEPSENSIILFDSEEKKFVFENFDLNKQNDSLYLKGLPIDDSNLGHLYVLRYRNGKFITEPIIDDNNLSPNYCYSSDKIYNLVSSFKEDLKEIKDKKEKIKKDSETMEQILPHVYRGANDRIGGDLPDSSFDDGGLSGVINDSLRKPTIIFPTNGDFVPRIERVQASEYTSMSSGDQYIETEFIIEDLDGNILYQRTVSEPIFELPEPITSELSN